MSELPQGWQAGALSELADTVRGVTYNKSQAQEAAGAGLLPILRANNIKSGKLSLDDLIHVPESCISSTQAVLQGDIVVAMSSGSRNVVGKTAQLETHWKGSFGAFCAVLRVSPDIDARYLYYFTQSHAYRSRVSELAAGVNINNLKPTHFEEIEIPVAPLEEQKRIAEKLDSVLSQVESIRTRIIATSELLDRFRRAIFESAVSGRMTTGHEESIESADELLANLKRDHEIAGGHLRGNAANPVDEAHDLEQGDVPSHWRVAEMRDICAPGRPITYGILKPGPELENGVPYIRVADFPGNKLNTSTVKNTSSEIDFAYRRARLNEGDLVLSIRGSVGRIIKIPAKLQGANITQDTARLSTSGRVSVDYVLIALKAESTQRRMRAAVRGVAVRGINIGDVRALQIPLPPRAEQDMIVQQSDRLFAIADQLNARIEVAKRHVEKLSKSLLSKAFRGELVPQDPQDEPAGLLLERIRAQRAASPKPKRGRKSAAN